MEQQDQHMEQQDQQHMEQQDQHMEQQDQQHMEQHQKLDQRKHCNNCGKTDHLMATCTYTKQQQKCTYCHKSGHLEHYCYKKKRDQSTMYIPMKQQHEDKSLKQQHSDTQMDTNNQIEYYSSTSYEKNQVEYTKSTKYFKKKVTYSQTIKFFGDTSEAETSLHSDGQCSFCNTFGHGAEQCFHKKNLHEETNMKQRFMMASQISMENDSKNWIMDSGATSHIYCGNDATCMTNYTKTKNLIVNGASGIGSKVLGRGNIKIGLVTLTKVFL